MSQEESQSEAHTHGDSCDYCNGDEAAIKRQEDLAERYEDFESNVIEIVGKFSAKAKEIYIRVREATEPYSLTKGAQRFEKFNDRLNEELMALSDKAAVVNANKEPLFQIGKNEKAALVGAALLTAQAASQTGAAVAAEPEVIPLKPVVSDLQMHKTIAEEFSKTPIAREKFKEIGVSEDHILLIPVKPLTIEQSTVSAESTPKITEVSDADKYILNLSEVEGISRELLIETMNVDVEAGQDTVQIKEPLTRTLHNGNSPADIARAMLGAENAKDKSAVYAITRIIVDMNDIDVAAGEDRLIKAGTELKLPYEIEEIVGTYIVRPGDTLSKIQKEMGEEDREKFLRENAIIDPNHIVVDWEILPTSGQSEAAHSNASNDVIEEAPVVEQEASSEVLDSEKALDQLISAIKTIENPKPVYDEIFTSEPLPTPVADRLEVKKQKIIEEVTKGTTNIEFIQSEAVLDVALEHSSLTVDGVARLMVSHVFEQAGFEPSQEELGDISEALVQGIVNENPMLKSVEDTEKVRIDNESKSIAELANELEIEVSADRDAVSTAAENLKRLGIEVSTDPALIAEQITHDRHSGSMIGDEYSYLLLDGKDRSEQVDLLLNNLSVRVYEHYGAHELLAQTEIGSKLITETADALSEEFVDLGGFINELETNLAADIEAAQQEITLVRAELTAIFPEMTKISNEEMNQLAVAHMVGRSNDFIRMSALEQVASLNEVTLSEAVATYYQKAIKNSGLEKVFSDQQIADLSEGALMVWVNDDFSSLLVSLDAARVIEEVMDRGLVELISANEDYLELAEGAEVDGESVEELIKAYLGSDEDSSKYDVAFIFAITEDHDQIDKYLRDYYTQNGAGNFINDDNIVQSIADVLLDHPELSPGGYTEALSRYGGNPEELFPDGRQYVLSDYKDSDLTEFMSLAGLNVEEILDHPLNSHIERTETGIIAMSPTIWFDDGSTLNEAAMKRIYDELILGIKPPESVKPIIETEEVLVKSSSNSIVSSLENVRYQDKINNLDNAVKVITEWYAGFEDPDKDPAMPEGYVRVPSHEFFDDLSIVYTWAEKTANSEEYTSPVAAAGVLAIAELYQQMIVEYPQYEGSMLRVRDLNSAHHRTHDDGRHVDVSTHMNSEVSQASTGPIMDYISGDGSNNEYNFDMNVEFATKLAGLRYEGNRVISRILTSDGKLAKEVNDRLGFKFMSDVDYHGEHWHINFHERYALESFRPQSPFDELGHKGDLGIGSEYKEPTPEMKDDEHGEFEEAIDEAVEDVKEQREAEEEREAAEEAATEAKAAEEKRISDEKAAAEKAEKERLVAEEAARVKAEEERVAAAKKAEEEKKATEAEEAQATDESKLPPGISKEQLIVSQANSVEKLAALGYSSLLKIPKSDQDKFNEVLSQKPDIEEAIDMYNSRQGDTWGPKIPATAVLAIAYDVGMRGDDLIDSVTTIRGESGGFSPYVIGDDKQARTVDGRVIRFSTGLGQFYQKNESGITEDELFRAQVLLDPVAAIIEMADYKENRGLKPWNFFNHREEQQDGWNAHKAKVLSAVQILEDGGFDIIP